MGRIAGAGRRSQRCGREPGRPLRAARGRATGSRGQTTRGLTGGQLIGEETRLLLELPAAANPLFGGG